MAKRVARQSTKLMNSLGAELPRMIARVAARIAEESELPPLIRRIVVEDALAAIGQAAEAIAVADPVAYVPAYARLKPFDL